MEKELICICCPKGCHLKVDLETKQVTGNGCPRGAKYGVDEVTNPVRVITTTIRVVDGKHKVVPVKTDKPIPKNLTFKCIEEINKIQIKAPIKIGQIIIENVLDTGANIVATRNIG